ncbi:penicillin-binding protein activator LpoB [Kistimonas scapharcae]|uniref:Penicillin-binding protein activator LpoB n=1 Tax=Kistimonas scapharcae TaxID=1036133 RepID=A0ABP8V7C9_9GAMM
MFNKTGKLAVVAMTVSLALLGGCATGTYYVDQNTDSVAVMTLDYKDFEKAASSAVDDMNASPLLIHPKAAQGARYVVAVSSILNDTTQRIDTDQLAKKVRVSLLQSGKFITTTAIGANGAEDKMTAQVRELQNSKLMNQKTVKKNGTVIAPDFSLSGKIIQRNHSVDSRTQQVDYYFQLTLTNLENGLAYWEGEYPIIKRGNNKTVTW